MENISFNTYKTNFHSNELDIEMRTLNNGRNYHILTGKDVIWKYYNSYRRLLFKLKILKFEKPTYEPYLMFVRYMTLGKNIKACKEHLSLIRNNPRSFYGI
jgi:hypothetical protein